MHKKHLEAYRNLIQELLSCPNGEEWELLQAHQELLDSDFIQVMEKVAEELEEKGDEEGADFLWDWADALVYQGIIEQLLNCASDEEAWQILDANRDWVDAGLQQTMLEVAEDLRTQGDLDNANFLMNLTEKLMEVDSNASDAQLNFLLQVLEATESSWGDAQVVYPLLKANTNKLDARLAELLRAWATTTLAEAKPDEAQEITAVIVLFSNSLSKFPLGNKAGNMEIAITGYKIALTVYTRDAFPVEWAMTHNNLAIAYSNRIRGDQAENLEQAIACYQQALKVYTFEDFPYEWATTQTNLANAYSNRIRGEQADNLEAAIACYQQALKVYTFDAFPVDWATTQNNLGEAYRNRIRGERAENLEVAIACYQEALKVYTFEAFPQDWATTQNNLGLAYGDRIRGKKADNLEVGIACLQEALKVYTFEAFPVDWAGTQNNLGLAYGDRILGERAENSETAIAAYKKVLTVRTREVFPQYHAETLSALGMAYQDSNRFTLAYNAFASAIATVESLRSEIVSGEESKRKQAEHFNEVYSHMVETCLELSSITEAIEYVERSKTRNLVEQILSRDLKTIFPPEVVTKLEEYRDKIATGQYQIQHGEAENPQVLTQHLQQLRQQRNQLQNRYLPIGYGFQFDSFQATLDERTAIIEWYILNDKILAFIVKPKGEVTVWQSQPEDLKALIDWVNQYLQNYYNQKYQWQNQLGEALKKLASILHIDEILTQIPDHCHQLILIPHTALHLFPLHALPVSQNSENSPCLLDLFAGGVSYAPSCQLLQEVQMRQRPNFQSLFAIQNPTEDLALTDLEVESILPYFPSHQVLPKEQATKAALTKAASQLTEAHCLHFSCHGYFNLESPQDSLLWLADACVEKIPPNDDSRNYLPTENKFIDIRKCLTLGNLFEREYNFDQCRLVVLSACETGLIDFKNTSDEYIGLPSGFLYAGSSSIISSLWSVRQDSTAYLLIKFYENLDQSLSVPLALKQAQLWLRDVTVGELETWVKHSRLAERFKPAILDGLEAYPLQKKPFASPYHWAAFCAVGK